MMSSKSLGLFSEFPTPVNFHTDSSDGRSTCEQPDDKTYKIYKDGIYRGHKFVLPFTTVILQLCFWTAATRLRSFLPITETNPETICSLLA